MNDGKSLSKEDKCASFVVVIILKLENNLMSQVFDMQGD
jgi:hypothetical protein